MRMSDSIPENPLASRLSDLGFPLSGKPLADLAAYLGRLIKWNKAMNLVGAATWEEALDDLVVDSFHLAAFLQKLPTTQNPVSWDLGAGAGLPGIPLRLVWREGTYTLIEAREKRALFMQTVLAGIDLGDTKVFHGRAEEFFRSGDKADLMVSRAFMPWRDMLSLAGDFLSPSGEVLFLTLSAAPDSLPEPWRLRAQTSYMACGKERWFWRLAKA